MRRSEGGDSGAQGRLHRTGPVRAFVLGQQVFVEVLYRLFRGAGLSFRAR